MGFHYIELTPADAVAQQETFQREFGDLLGSRQITVLPPFPDYSLISQTRAPKALLKAVNSVVLSHRPAYDRQFGWLLLPLVHKERIIGVILAEDVERRWDDTESSILLERTVHLCLEKLHWQKRWSRDSETLLWRREQFIHEIAGAIDMAEKGGSLKRRRSLSDGPCLAHFTVLCFVIDPAPAPWAGAGSFWVELGPQVGEVLPDGAVAAHLGGGYLGVLWPRAYVGDVQAWTNRLLQTLTERYARLQKSGEDVSVAVGSVTFPEDFYEDGPYLPWEKSEVGERLTAAWEVVHRSVLAAETARKHEKRSMLAYGDLCERGIVPKRESAIEKRISGFLCSDGPGVFLMVKLDDWRGWQEQYGSRSAAIKAEDVLTCSKTICPEKAAVDWAGPDRFGVFIPGANADSAQEQGRRIRETVKRKLRTTVSIGLSVHPCPGFAKKEILENSRKALYHSSFFGADTQTLFDAVSLNINGDRLYEAGHIEAAVQEFKRGLMLEPNNVNVRNSLGVCYAQTGRLDEAVAEFSKVAALEPDDFMPQYNLGCALLNLKRVSEAEQAFSRAAELEDENASVFFQLGMVCMERHRPEDALGYLQRAVDLKPNWAQAWRLLGECLLEQTAYNEAMNAFKTALRFNSNDASALSSLAIIYGRTEANLEIALSLAHRSVELEPDNPRYVQRLATLLLKNRQPEEARVQCERALAMAPDDKKIRRLHDRIAMAQRASTS